MTAGGLQWPGDLGEVAERLAARVGDASHLDLALKLLGTLAGAYLTQVCSDPARPAFVPGAGYHTRYGSPNPDTVYRTASVDGAGTYRLTGTVGTAPDVTLMPFGPPTAGGLLTLEPIDLRALATGDGALDVVLGSAGPARHAPPAFVPLDPRTRSLMLRSVSEEWGAHTDPRLAIVRLDDATPAAPADVERRLGSVAAMAERMVVAGLERVDTLRAQEAVNRLVDVDYATAGGRDGQWYQEGLFSVPAGHGLLIEVPPDPAGTAFSVSLTDACFSTLDWGATQCSLNSRQAVIDPDGWLRLVVSGTDPGVANWLDSGGHETGVVQCRWVGSRTAPAPVLTLLPLAEVRPGAAPVSPAQRTESLRARQAGVQLRTYW